MLPFPSQQPEKMMLKAKMTRANLNQNEWVHFQRITIIIVHNRNLTENAIPRKI
jgi:hypothetical protein